MKKIILLASVFLSVIACKKEEKTEEEATDKILGAVNINGAYTTYTRSTLAIYLNEAQEFENYLVFSKYELLGN